jgi:hypothetical protein
MPIPWDLSESREGASGSRDCIEDEVTHQCQGVLPEIAVTRPLRVLQRMPWSFENDDAQMGIAEGVQPMVIRKHS